MISASLLEGSVNQGSNYRKDYLQHVHFDKYCVTLSSKKQQEINQKLDS